MKLNNSSYGHLRVRFLCATLENTTGMKLITNLSDDFAFLQFKGRFSYLTINYQMNMYSILNCKLNKAEADMVEDIIVTLNFIELGHRIDKLTRNNKKLNKKKY